MDPDNQNLSSRFSDIRYKHVYMTNKMMFIMLLFAYYILLCFVLSLISALQVQQLADLYLQLHFTAFTVNPLLI